MSASNEHAVGGCHKGAPVAARSPSELEAVCRWVHGAWADVDSLRFDAESEVLELRLDEAPRGEPVHQRRGWLWSTYVYAVSVWVMRIRGVLRYSLDDRAQIGRVELGTITYDAGAHELIIASEFPVTLAARVRSVDIEIEPTDTVVNRKRIMLLNWIEIER
ncbi:MAG: hypothetical protein Kow00105_20420 [Phycisphaeraceae bacterium]